MSSNLRLTYTGGLLLKDLWTSSSTKTKRSNPRKISFKPDDQDTTSSSSTSSTSTTSTTTTDTNVSKNARITFNRDQTTDQSFTVTDKKDNTSPRTNNNNNINNNNNNNNSITESVSNPNKIIFTQQKEQQQKQIPLAVMPESVFNDDDFTPEEKEYARMLPASSSPLSDPTMSAAYDSMFAHKRFPITGKGKQHLYEMSTDRITPDVYFSNKQLTLQNVLKYMSRMGLLGHADIVMDCLKYLDEKNLEIDPAIYSLVLRALGIAGDVDGALAVFERLLTEKVKPTVHMFDGVLNAHLNAAKVDDAFKILQSMEDKYNLVPDHVNYTTMIKGLAKNGQIDTAIELFSDAKVKGMDPDSITLTAMIDVCAKDDRVEKAFNYFDEFKYLNLPPTEVTFNSLINACAKRSDNYYYLKAFEMFQQMSMFNYQPDIITYTSLMRAASVRGEISVVEKLYADILERKDLFPKKPDDRVFSLMIGTYAKNQIDAAKTKYKANMKPNLERVDQILADMERLEVPMTKYPLDQYLKAYAYSNKVNTCEKFFEEKYKQYGVVPDVVSYSIMISLYCNTRRFEKAQKLFQQMREQGIQPDYKLYKIMMYGTTKVGYANTCLKLAKEMVERGFPPESKDMENIYKRYREYPEIINQLKEMTVSSEAKPSYRSKMFARSIARLAVNPLRTYGGLRMYSSKTYFTKTHEWINVSGTTGTVGITDSAQNQLGDIVFLELPAVGTVVSAASSFGVIESTKAASDIYSPVSGEVIEVNDQASAEPSLINKSAEKDGWMIKLRISDKSELDKLFDQEPQ
ncbi:hypothetical protein SAMD00019534_002820 [Acytostelium subglobosum LB1]|uniref:hypothetical protein n=1 Tax=Acytostelium subglobosum LB1 TaxID=1410327 RepID=UPI0006451AE3|nr:hypothetical protein SAMD00019534_002820 [Acytostelium subglobosum LB1]GAM17107.1 hypothetical protein SAMD00019534_002820 [Acytostelium subglobosum LB1]|eukprot:XP_012759169.1 hypothetical protein SAMD00019534_002820 [Acytostelium subglobosum LB1]